MEVKENRTIQDIAVFILDNKKATIDFLNRYGYAVLSANAGREVVNKAVADNMFNEEFWMEFLSFMEDTREGEKYYNAAWVAIVQAVSSVAKAVNKMMIDAKMALFSRNMAWRQDERNKETEQFYQELAELNAKKEMAINMNVAQQQVLLAREQQEEKGKTMRNIAIFGVFVVGALVIAYITKKNRKI